MYIAREREREIHRRLWIVGRTWPTNIPSISFPARERGQTRRDRDNETSPPSSLFPTRYLLVQRDSWPFSTRSRKERNFCLYVYIYIYIYFSTRRIEGGGRRYPRFEYIFFYTMGVRTYDGTDLGYACRVEEKKKYLLDGPRIEFLRRLVLPSEDGKRRGLTNRER